MRKGREDKAGPSADLSLCFPSRPHWNALMPKPICSPGKASESNNRRRHLSKSTTTLLWAKAKSAASVDTAEPSSPKVTCAGQIKVRQSTTACSNWHSMIDEMEKIHDDGKLRKRPSWAKSLGLKREIMQFLCCLRTLRFDFRCFGSFPAEDNTTEDENYEEEGYQENQVGMEETSDDATSAIFSKWFMMLHENQNSVFDGEDRSNEENISDDGFIAESGVPPPNALLLMRCRSAPAKSWFQENHEREKEDRACADEVEQITNEKLLMEKDETKKENMVVLRYDSDFDKMSLDIVKESWIVGRLRDTLSKSRSWKR
ncbi:hypothetical protein K1719_025482 [Acacia pycnantha]|nr:hypothetical protein K1719_025482 [Acacia pycnantha]